MLREARTAAGLSQRELEAGKPTKAIDRLFEFALETGITFRAESRDG